MRWADLSKRATLLVMVVREELLTQERYRLRYGPDVRPATLAVEREVLGCDYGGNGYTTVAQADQLGVALALAPGRRLLDLGAGCGWPGLYLTRTTGCSTVLTDLSQPAMQRARRRAQEESTQARAAVVVASARHLPFRPECFDAIVHTDVLC